jgi:hypothetical protein
VHTVRTERGWAFFQNEGRPGTGDWRYFGSERLHEVYRAAEEWQRQLAGIERPWLCWSLDPRWCYVQQQLVVRAGWTPVVGTDGSPRPPLVDDAVFVDFNESLALPGMWMHFVIEFAFLFTGKLAFWHSDVLPPADDMLALGRQFDRIANGTMVATWRPMRLPYMVSRVVRGKRIRGVRGWCEFVGCTTQGASEDQFRRGAGWWRGLERHPNAAPDIVRRRPHWEHGVGIRYWQQLFGGHVQEVCVDVDVSHYSRAGRGVGRYSRAMIGTVQTGSKKAELDANFNIEQIVSTLGRGIALP